MGLGKRVWFTSICSGTPGPVSGDENDMTFEASLSLHSEHVPSQCFSPRILTDSRCFSEVCLYKSTLSNLRARTFNLTHEIDFERDSSRRHSSKAGTTQKIGEADHIWIPDNFYQVSRKRSTHRRSLVMSRLRTLLGVCVG